MSETQEIKMFNTKGILPKYSTPGSAGMDIELIEDLVWESNGQEWVTVVDTGLYMVIPERHVIKIFPRSGYGFRLGMKLINTVGIIDSDYRGEIKIKLVISRKYNYSDLPKTKGTKIAQMILEEVPEVKIKECSLEDIKNYGTERGDGGFGSTGK